MEGVPNSGFKIYGLGLVADDKLEDNWYIPVYLLEHLPAEQSELRETETHTAAVYDASGQASTVTLKRGKNVTARWLGLGQSGRFTPPSVRRGEEVIIFTRPGGVDMYYWEVCATEYDRRKQEKYMVAVNDTEKIGNKDIGNMYYQVMDTINKNVRLHLSKADGEYCTYDEDYDTKKGHYIWIDGHHNFIELDSPTSTMHLKVNSHLTLSAAGIDQKDQYKDTHDYANSYHYDIDNFNMHIRESLPRVVGKEQSMYRRILDGKNGKYRFEDDHGNWEELNSVTSDYSSNVGNNVSKKIGNSQSIDIGNNQTVTIANNQSVTVGNNSSTNVGGNSTENVSINKSISAGGDVVISGANVTIQAAGVITLSASAINVSTSGGGGSATFEIGGDMTVKTGGIVKIN